MNLTNRIKKLEQQRGGDMPEVVMLYFDEGKVTKEHNSNTHPELIGKTEAEIDALYSARDDVLVVKIVYASQVHGNSTDD